jgi:hypothetical protein
MGWRWKKGLEATFKRCWKRDGLKYAYALIMKLDLILRVPKPDNQYFNYAKGKNSTSRMIKVKVG